MKAISTQAKETLRRYWPWMTVAVLIIAGLIYSLANGTFEINPVPPSGFKNITRPSDANYPKLNPHPKRVVTISGTMPATLPVQLIAVYFTNVSTSEFASHKGCYRTYFIAPWRPLFVAEPLSLANANESYETRVTVDKYDPGFCHWHLSSVMYVLGDQGLRVGNNIFETGIYDSAVAFGEPSPSWPFHGPLNIWCKKNQDWEFCSTWLGVSRNRPTNDVSEDERGDHFQTLVTPDMSSIVLNFRDFDALPAETNSEKSH